MVLFLSSFQNELELIFIVPCKHKYQEARINTVPQRISCQESVETFRSGQKKYHTAWFNSWSAPWRVGRRENLCISWEVSFIWEQEKVQNWKSTLKMMWLTVKCELVQSRLFVPLFTKFRNTLLKIIIVSFNNKVYLWPMATSIDHHDSKVASRL